MELQSLFGAKLWTCWQLGRVTRIEGIALSWASPHWEVTIVNYREADWVLPGEGAGGLSPVGSLQNYLEGTATL